MDDNDVMDYCPVCKAEIGGHGQAHLKRNIEAHMAALHPNAQSVEETPAAPEPVPEKKTKKRR